MPGKLPQEFPARLLGFIRPSTHQQSVEGHCPLGCHAGMPCMMQ